MKKIFIILILLLLPVTVFADTGPKPSINITLKNMKSTNYKIDLLSDFSNNKDNIDKIVEYYSEYKNEPIYKYHEGNMYATCLRNFLLHGSIEGNKNKTHTFTYFGVPDKFKVIIQMPDGSIRVSKLLTKKTFDYNVTIDVNDMKVVNESENNNLIIKFFIILLITVIIELLIAFIFKTKKYALIVLTNIVTNSLLQIMVINIPFIINSVVLFILLEFIVFIFEYAIYLKYMNIDNKKILYYTIVANLVTAFLTFVV